MKPEQTLKYKPGDLLLAVDYKFTYQVLKIKGFSKDCQYLVEFVCPYFPGCVLLSSPTLENEHYILGDDVLRVLYL